MVSTPSKKKFKFTYADSEDIHSGRHLSLLADSGLSVTGVVGALSEVQKQHRKHAIHLATLRAQGNLRP